MTKSHRSPNDFRKERAATQDPEARFSSPDDVVSDNALTREEKIAALKHWRFTVDQRLAAGDEGMPPAGTEARDAELLRRIDLVIADLEG